MNAIPNAGANRHVFGYGDCKRDPTNYVSKRPPEIRERVGFADWSCNDLPRTMRTGMGELSIPTRSLSCAPGIHV